MDQCHYAIKFKVYLSIIKRVCVCMCVRGGRWNGKPRKTGACMCLEDGKLHLTQTFKMYPIQCICVLHFDDLCFLQIFGENRHTDDNITDKENKDVWKQIDQGAYHEHHGSLTIGKMVADDWGKRGRVEMKKKSSYYMAGWIWCSGGEGEIGKRFYVTPAPRSCPVLFFVSVMTRLFFQWHCLDWPNETKLSLHWP